MGGECFCAGAETWGEGDFGSAAALAVVKRTVVDLGIEHFFETEGLGAELDFVAGIELGLAAFVFDGEGAPTAFESGELDAVGGFVKFDDVGLPSEAEAEGVDTEAARSADAWAAFGTGLVGAFVEDAPFGGEAIFLPHLFEVDEAPLAFAEEEVLEAGEWEEVVFLVHGV